MATTPDEETDTVPSRIILLLLIVRMIAAPVAQRPTNTRHRSSSGLVLRVCSWPAQVAQSTSIRLAEGLDGSAPSLAFLSPRPSMSGIPLSAPAVRIASPCDRGLHGGDRLRC
jgi:hypothetical protein